MNRIWQWIAALFTDQARARNKRFPAYRRQITAGAFGRQRTRMNRAAARKLGGAP